MTWRPSSDCDASRYLGKGVERACSNVVDKILPALKNMSLEDVASVDKVK